MTRRSLPRFHLIAACLLAGGLSVFLFSCNRSASAATPEAMPANYLAYARGQVDVEGGLVAMPATCSGIIRDVGVTEGDSINADQILAEIDNSPARLALAISTATLAESRVALAPLHLQLAAARREVARLQPLLPTQAVAQTEADQAADRVAALEAAITSAEAAVVTAEARVQADTYAVNRQSIHAPIKGRIVKSYARPGITVVESSPTPLFLVEPAGPHIVRAEVEGRFVDKLTPGMAAEVVVNEDTGRVIPARILRIGAFFGPKPPGDEPGARIDQRVVECVIALPDDSLRVGQRVLVRVPQP